MSDGTEDWLSKKLKRAMADVAIKNAHRNGSMDAGDSATIAVAAMVKSLWGRGVPANEIVASLQAALKWMESDPFAGERSEMVQIILEEADAARAAAYLRDEYGYVPINVTLALVNECERFVRQQQLGDLSALRSEIETNWPTKERPQ